MERIMILNGSPRAPKSNSRQYAGIFSQYCRKETAYFNITAKNHEQLCMEAEKYSDMLIVFPLYADALPVTLLNFLKTLETNPPHNKPVISVLVNCGFLEYRQNETAVSMMQLFCKQNGYRFGSVLMLGSGEAILGTPFRFIAKRAIRKLAESVAEKRYTTLHASMPMPKRLFIMAADRYWTNYGKRYGITREQMQTKKIE